MRWTGATLLGDVERWYAEAGVAPPVLSLRQRLAMQRSLEGLLSELTDATICSEGGEAVEEE